MAEISTIARPYAEALFEVARKGDLREWAEIIDAMAGVANHAEMRLLLSNPKLSAEQVYDIFTGTLGWNLNIEAQNFIRTLIDNGRLVLMPEIATQFHQLKNEAEGSADAQIVSAFELNDAQIADLVRLLENKFKSRLNPIVTTDKSLIGGVRVVVGDEVLDTSVRSRLDQMRSALVS